MRSLAVAPLLVLALAGCAGPPATEPAPDERAITPVLDENFPDPDVLEVDGTYYLYATEGDRRNVQVATSTDLRTWEVLPDALPELPSWVIPGKTWAPEVTEVGDGQYVLYFTATNFSPAVQCIGVATATDPAGPFTVQGDGMLVCPDEEGGAIDASTFVDTDGTLHLVWKNDGNCCGLDTWLQTAPLSADGLSLAGEITRLVMQTESWEGALVEAPTVLVRDGVYHLWYSANDYGGEQYAIGHATAPALEGPWTKGDGPWLSTDATEGAIVGPGGQDVVVGPDGADAVVLHGWDPSYTYRRIYLLPMSWEGDDPVPQL